MSKSLPDDIHSERLADGTRWRLPRPPLGITRIGGAFSVMLGFMFSGFAVFWMAMASQAMWDKQGQFQWFGLAFMSFGIPFVLAGLAPLFAGLFLLIGRYDIEIRDKKLWTVSRIGFLRKRRGAPLDKIAALRIGSPASGVGLRGNVAGVMSSISGLSSLTAEGRHIPPLCLARGYPPGWLADLADQIVGHTQGYRPGRLMSDKDSPIRVINQQADPTDRTEQRLDGFLESIDTETDAPDEVLQQPYQSKIILDQHRDGPTLTIPARGIWRGSKGLFSFSLIWNGIVGVISTVMVLCIFGVIPVEGDSIPLWVGLFMLPFWAVGLGTLIGAINMGRRRAIVDIVHGTLLVSRQNLFGSKQHEWRPNEIKDIQIGSSGFEVNDVPVMELKIIPKTGKKIGLFAEREDDELRWMASILRNAVGLKRSV